MKLSGTSLNELVDELRSRIELDFKRDIQSCASEFGSSHKLPWMPEAPQVENGDDAAAIEQPDGSFLLFATDGMRPEFVESDPWFAGYSSVMVNVSDIAAMGGRPTAIVDVLYLGERKAERVIEGMHSASCAFGVPIVGGHTCRTTGPTLVSCAIVGRATSLLKSSAARADQALLYAVDLRGVFRSHAAFNAATTTPNEQLRAQIGLLSECAERGWVVAAKDVSNAGLLGTVLMLLESSGIGASLDLEAIPAPPDVEAVRWLAAFPSFGFVLCAAQSHVERVRAHFGAAGITCARIGTTTASPLLSVHWGTTEQSFADTRHPLTGFGASPCALSC